MNETITAAIEHRVQVKPYTTWKGVRRWRATCSVCRWASSGDTQAEAADTARTHRFPALQLLIGLGPGPETHYSGSYGPGLFCPDCPFRDPADSYEERDGIRIDNDPTEAHYDCSLLGQKVWGEYSPCTDADWRGQARRELAALAGPYAPAEAS